MRRHLFIFVFLFLAGSLAHAFELVMIQSISDTRRTFVIRNGKRQGFIQGMTGTFTAEDVSFIARVVTVTGNYTQWELVNPEARIPFEKGTVVTFYPVKEYLWALSPEKERQKYIKSVLGTPRRSMVFKGALTRGLNESVSDAPATTSKRGGFLAETYYEKDFFYGFAWDVGLRYEREAVNYPAATFITRRNLFLADIIYYFDQLQDVIGGRIYIGGGFGYGMSNTTTVGLSQSGPVAMLPAVKAGLNLPFNDDWEFLLDSAFESLQTRESQSTGKVQTTTQTNFRAGFGLRRLF